MLSIQWKGSVQIGGGAFLEIEGVSSGGGHFESEGHESN